MSEVHSGQTLVVFALFHVTSIQKASLLYAYVCTPTFPRHTVWIEHHDEHTAFPERIRFYRSESPPTNLEVGVIHCHLCLTVVS